MLRTYNIFDPNSKEPYKLSCSNLELFLECPRCFYLSKRFGINRVRDSSFILNNAIDSILAKDPHLFENKSIHDFIFNEYKINLFFDKEIERLRKLCEKGMQFFQTESNLIITGYPDDVWKTSDGKIHAVNYIRTYSTREILQDDNWKQGCKWLMELNQWLLRKNGLDVSNVGYFLFITVNLNKKLPTMPLETNLDIVEYLGNDEWVDEAIQFVQDCLIDNEVPDLQESCEWCTYAKNIASIYAKENSK